MRFANIYLIDLLLLSVFNLMLGYGPNLGGFVASLSIVVIQ